MKDSTLEKFLAAYLFAQKELADVQSAYKRSLENLFVPRCGNTGEFISAYGYAVTKDGEIWYEITEDFSCVGTIGKNGRFYPKRKLFGSCEIWNTSCASLKNTRKHLNMCLKRRALSNQTILPEDDWGGSPVETLCPLNAGTVAGSHNRHRRRTDYQATTLRRNPK